MLLTSGGISNDTLASELEGLAKKPFDKLKISFIISAAFGSLSEDKGWLINDLARLKDRGASVAIISLADLTQDEIAQQLKKSDVIFVGGGQTFYLSWIMQQKGLFDLLPKLLEDKVYVGISAGSMIMTMSLATVSFAIVEGQLRDDLGPAGRSSAKCLGLVPFLFRPHLGSQVVEEINNGALERISNQTGLTIYAVDDNSAVKVVDDNYLIVGEGKSKVVKPK